MRRISRFTHIWNRGIAKIINMRVDVSGNIPDLSGGLVVSNHLGYIDIVVHGSLLPMRYSPKADISRWPILGWYIGLSRPIWIDREAKKAARKALRDFAKTMKRGMYMIVYPEGTSSNGKSGILPFRSTSFEAAITGNLPIIPMLTSYKEAPGGPEICWYGDMKLLPHIWNVLKAPALEARIRFLDPVYPEGRSRKELASYVHGIMDREYRKLALG